MSLTICRICTFVTKKKKKKCTRNYLIIPHQKFPFNRGQYQYHIKLVFYLSLIKYLSICKYLYLFNFKQQNIGIY